MWLNGPISRKRSSDSVASTTCIVEPMPNNTSTDRDSVNAGGISVQECTSPSGGEARSLGLGSSYRGTDIRLLLDNRATRPVE